MPIVEGFFIFLAVVGFTGLFVTPMVGAVLHDWTEGRRKIKAVGGRFCHEALSGDLIEGMAEELIAAKTHEPYRAAVCRECGRPMEKSCL
jgi:uncharacterized protein YqgC (DUF456 family)